METIDDLKSGMNTAKIESETKYVEKEVERIAHKEVILKKDLEELNLRLQPVLRPEQPTAAYGKEDAPIDRSPIANQLSIIGDELEMYHQWIMDLLSRLDV